MSWFVTVAEIVVAVAAVAGGTVAAVSAHQQGQAQEDAAKANAQIAANNASAEAATAAENAKRKREDNRRQLASIRSRMAGGGVQIGAGSSLDVLGTAASELELQTLDMFNSSQARQVQYGNEAKVDLWSGQQAASAGNTAAIGSLLSGIGSAAGGYTKYRDTGVGRVAPAKGSV